MSEVATEKKPDGRLCPSCDRFIRKTCSGYEWYEPKEIRYCREQMVWLVGIMDLLEDGHYPLDPYVSGYVGGGFSGIRASAPYELAEQLAGEVNMRLWTKGKTGEAGAQLLWDIYKLGITQYNQLSPLAQQAVRYISGSWQKVQNFSDWKAHQEKDKFIPYQNTKMVIAKLILDK